MKACRIINAVVALFTGASCLTLLWALLFRGVLWFVNVHIHAVTVFDYEMASHWLETTAMICLIVAAATLFLVLLLMLTALVIASVVDAVTAITTKEGDENVQTKSAYKL